MLHAEEGEHVDALRLCQLLIERYRGGVQERPRRAPELLDVWRAVLRTDRLVKLAGSGLGETGPEREGGHHCGGLLLGDLSS